MGLQYFLDTYAPSENIRTESDLTHLEWNEWLEAIYYHDPESSRVIFISPKIASALQEWHKSQIRFQPSKNPQTLGMTFTDYVTPHGAPAKLVINPLLKGHADSSWHYAFAVDMSGDKIKMVNYDGFTLAVERDVVKNGKRRTVDKLHWYGGYEFRMAPHHGYLKMKSFS